MALSIRQSEILALARAEGRVLVDDLAHRFDVTLQTIRRDLGDLAEAGLVDRVHGGAVPRAGTVKAILIANEQPVEYDQPLIVIE